MIWLDGTLTAEARVAIPLVDPFLAHGLGLFETFRTWEGVAPLLPRHLARLRASAQALGLDFSQAQLPDAEAVRALTDAHGRPDALLRLTVTAGHPPDIRPTAWMTCTPLPPPPPSAGYRVVDRTWALDSLSELSRHKSTNYWARRRHFEAALTAGADEAILWGIEGRIWEGSRTSLFLVRDRTLITPPLDGPIVPGVMRGLVLERAAGAGFAAEEADVWPELIRTADEVFLTNSVRGLIPVREWSCLYQPQDLTFPATRRLRDHLIDPRTGPKP